MKQGNIRFNRLFRACGAILALLCASFILQGQTTHRVPGPGLYPPAIAGTEEHLQFPPGKTLPPVLNNRKDPASASAVVQSHPKAWDYQHLALFCKLEVQMEKAFRLPVRIRLGDVPYVDWLEGKRQGY